MNKIRFNMFIEQDLKDKIAELALENERTVTGEIITAIKYYIEHKPRCLVPIKVEYREEVKK